MNQDDRLMRPVLEDLSQLELIDEYKTLLIILSNDVDPMNKQYLIARLGEIEDMLPENVEIEP